MVPNWNDQEGLSRLSSLQHKGKQFLTCFCFLIIVYCKWMMAPVFNDKFSEHLILYSFHFIFTVCLPLYTHWHIPLRHLQKGWH